MPWFDSFYSLEAIYHTPSLFGFCSVYVMKIRSCQSLRAGTDFVIAYSQWPSPSSIPQCSSLRDSLLSAAATSWKPCWWAPVYSVLNTYTPQSCLMARWFLLSSSMHGHPRRGGYALHAYPALLLSKRNHATYRRSSVFRQPLPPRIPHRMWPFLLWHSPDWMWNTHVIAQSRVCSCPVSAAFTMPTVAEELSKCLSYLGVN